MERKNLMKEINFLNRDKTIVDDDTLKCRLVKYFIDLNTRPLRTLDNHFMDDIIYGRIVTPIHQMKMVELLFEIRPILAYITKKENVVVLNYLKDNLINGDTNIDYTKLNLRYLIPFCMSNKLINNDIRVALMDFKGNNISKLKLLVWCLKGYGMTNDLNKVYKVLKKKIYDIEGFNIKKSLLSDKSHYECPIQMQHLRNYGKRK